MAALDGALTAGGVAGLADLSKEAAVNGFKSSVEQVAAHKQRIRSRVTLSDPNMPDKTPNAVVAQMFGQRFIVDSFVLANVVFDSIVFRGEKQRRGMPSGLDVFAALGNDEAISLLGPDLSQFKYGSNLMAARAVADSYGDGDWGASVFNGWLDSLRTLDAPAPATGAFPQAMKTRAWQHKQLQTQLASWAELRRDTILYSTQSYSASTACEYPTGYVEPYPDFFRRLEVLGRNAASAFSGLDVSVPSRKGPDYPARLRDHIVEYWTRFAATNARLAALASKELAGQPFTSDETVFVKQTLNMRFAASGPPSYDGWYPKLFFGGEPAKRSPTIADVHNDPESKSVLEAATGDPTFLVVAIDNGSDRAVYVGPVSSYYELRQPMNQRMNDTQWEQRLSGGPQLRPAWVSSFQAPPVAREMAEAPRR